MMCCLTLVGVFQVYIWKASEGNCNSHLPACLLLEKQEEHNKNIGGGSFLSSVAESKALSAFVG